MNVVPSSLRLSAQRALLGAIYPEVRLIKVKLVGQTIVVTTVAAAPLSEIASDALSIAATEIVADFPTFHLEEHIVVHAGPLPRKTYLKKDGSISGRIENHPRHYSHMAKDRIGHSLIPLA